MQLFRWQHSVIVTISCEPGVFSTSISGNELVKPYMNFVISSEIIQWGTLVLVHTCSFRVWSCKVLSTLQFHCHQKELGIFSSTQDEATDAAFHCSNPQQRFIQLSLSCPGHIIPLEGTHGSVRWSQIY